MLEEGREGPLLKITIQEGRAPQGKREPQIASSRLLEALGGIEIETSAGKLVDKGAYLWGVENSEKGKGTRIYRGASIKF